MIDWGQLEGQILTAMKRQHVAGLAMAVVEGDQLIYQRGLGVRSMEEPSIPMTPETLFRIGSITKPLTALLILRLVAAGKLDLDTPITDYLPWLTFSNPDYAPLITLRRLLSHTAGLPSSYHPIGRRDPAALQDYIATYIPTYPFIVPPNIAYAYSNPSFRLAGYVAEAMMGKPYAQLMQREVFDPLGMTRTTFDPTIAMTYPHTVAHDWDEKTGYTVRHQFGDNAGTYPSGGAISNVLDLARLLQMFLHNGGDFLPASLIADMFKPHANRFTAQGGQYGLGLSLVGGRGGHDGLTASFGGRFQVDPHTGRGVVLLCNRVLSFWDSLDRIFEQVLGVLPLATEPNTVREGQYVGAERGWVQIKNGEIWWNGRAASLDLGMAGEYLMVNSFPCQPAPDIEIIPTPTDLTPYLGSFTGADDLIFTESNGVLQVWSLEYDTTSPCLPLSDGRWACDFGTLTFSDRREGQYQRALLGVAYPLRRA